MGRKDAQKQLELAEKHLDRVQSAGFEPTDWDDLVIYGFYCLEATVMAAAIHFGVEVKRTHWSKADASETLHASKGLPEVKDLLESLNQARKAMAYGDVPRPDLDPEDIAAQIEAYVDEVGTMIRSGDEKDE